MLHSLRASQAPEREPFSQCWVEGHRGVFGRAQRARRKALLASLLLQIALLAVVVALPLLATGERLKPYHIVPIPPYRGSGHSITPHRLSHGGAHTATNPVVPRFLYQPLRIPTEVGTPSAGWRPDEGGPAVTGGGIPDGPLPPVENPATDFPWRTPPPPLRPSTQHPQGPLKRSEGVQEALLVTRVEPIYPALARQAHMEGTVQLRALIGRDGSVSALEVLSGPPILAQAALAAVSQWRYRPTLLNHEPVEVETYVTVIFQFQH